MTPRSATRVRGACIDCPEGAPMRLVSRPGPRCASHHRVSRRRRSKAAWEKRIWAVYHLTAERYWRIYDAQGGVCAWCQRATGERKRLSIDHDHGCCKGPSSCGKCVRGLLCTTCNKTLGHFRDSPMAIERGARYLEVWPAWDVR